MYICIYIYIYIYIGEQLDSCRSCCQQEAGRRACTVNAKNKTKNNAWQYSRSPTAPSRASVRMSLNRHYVSV